MNEIALAVGALRPDDVAEALTPEEMDRWEAHFRVKWQREAMAMAHATARLMRSQGSDIEPDGLNYIGEIWPTEE